MFFFWLATGAVSFALVGFHRDDIKAQKAAKKAMRVTGLGNIGFFAAIVVLYSISSPRTLDIGGLIAQSATLPKIPSMIAGFGVLLGALGMSAQVPSTHGYPGRWKLQHPLRHW
jgi:NADH-quinone oxidoreductase subunit L